MVYTLGMWPSKGESQVRPWSFEEPGPSSRMRWRDMEQFPIRSLYLPTLGSTWREQEGQGSLQLPMYLPSPNPFLGLHRWAPGRGQWAASAL
jgi:hypothetical protein